MRANVHSLVIERTSQLKDDVRVIRRGTFAFFPADDPRLKGLQFFFLKKKMKVHRNSATNPKNLILPS